MSESSENVLILTTVSGFLQKFERENVKLLKEAGCNVVYCANAAESVYLYDEKCFEDMGVDFHSVPIAKSPFNLLNNFRAWQELKSIITNENITVIHCHTPVGGLLGRLLGKKFSLKVLYTSHGFHFYNGASRFNNLIFKGAEKFLARFSDAIIVINKEDFAAASAFKLKNGGKVFQIPGVGLDMDKFSPLTLDEKKNAREALGLKENEFFLVSAGELNTNKNHRVIIDALSILKKDGIENIRLAICGEGPEREHLEKQIKKLGLQGQVTLYGYCNDIKSFTGSADVFLFPSKREGLGMAALEALAMEIPVIAADNRGSREYMSDGKNGFVCYNNLPEEYAEKIKKLIFLPQEELLNMKKECRRSSEKFSNEKTNGIMSAVYKRYI